MNDYRYFGTFASFLPADKTAGELLQGADFLVGDVFDVVFRQTGEGTARKDAVAKRGVATGGAAAGAAETSDGGAGAGVAGTSAAGAGDAAVGADGSHSGEIAWVRNRFGAWAGALDAEASRTLRIMVARGWVCRALLSFVAFTDSPEPGYYWGQVALVCYDPEYAEAFEPWIATLGSKMADGARVQVALTASEVDKVIESRGTWLPAARAEIPQPEKGKTAILKKSRSASEKLVELGRERRPGCMVVGWIFNVALVLGLVALILHWCGVF